MDMKTGTTATNKKKTTPSRATRDSFLDIVEPELLAWGLEKHPSPRSHYGGADFGYCWDFADVSDLNNVKIVAFAIINPGQNLVIEGLRNVKVSGEISALPIVSSTSEGVFRLTPKWSIWRPLSAYFKLRLRRGQAPQDAAETMMLDVRARLPLLHDFLYE
jgi:hypothetical protein